MSQKRTSYSEEFKFGVAVRALGELQTINEIASEAGVHPSQVKQWKRQLKESGPEVFRRKGKEKAQGSAHKENELYEQIGRLKMELEWLKKKAAPFG